MKNITLRQLRVFSAAARLLNFGKAAQEMHLTPPAVSIQIRELESQVGLPLFERQGKSVSLSPAGEYFLVYARKILATLKDAEDAMARLRGIKAGRLTIGMVCTAQYFVPRLLARFHESYPYLDVRLAVGNRAQLIEQLQNSELDLAIMGQPPKEMDTRAEVFAAHPMGVVVPPGHELARGGPHGPELLAQFHLIMREPGSGTRATFEEYLLRHRVELQMWTEMPSNESIKQAVMAGMGISFLSLHTVGLELRDGLLVVPPVQGMPVLRRWYVTNSQSKLLSPAAETFRLFVLEHGEAFLAETFGLPEPMPDVPGPKARPVPRSGPGAKA
ncbi:LysR family transcriptional regulator [Thiomonas sp.]|uniref:LysR family transcriptional regulator n=1 Tax=Thiomonas sp. TaxID=2047785 RepID=UPI002601D959|nr:LysR family transcriptional regulator [Thiomonas sp.]